MLLIDPCAVEMIAKDEVVEWSVEEMLECWFGQAWWEGFVGWRMAAGFNGPGRTFFA
jgi:hypothetical protein